jgi:ATP-dependent Clp protease ATP-binding subunit ClpC
MHYSSSIQTNMTKKEEDFNYMIDLDPMRQGAETLRNDDGFSFPDEDEDGLFADNDDDDDVRDNASKNNSSANRRQVNTKKKSKTPIIDHFSHDLTQAASEGKLDPVVGRSKEIERVIEILGRRKKNNPILIGEPGVGKSAIVEGLAQLIDKQQVSGLLFNKRVVELDMTAMVAGTKFRGQFEDRIKGLIRELEESPDIIVFIDEIHTIVGAGNAQGSMDAANILKPALARGVIQCIGATTLNEYRNSIEKDGALERRFQKVIVEPTTAEETLQILNNVKERYEEHHHVVYSDDALQACVKLADRYVTDRFFPDKAIDIIDEVGSHIHHSHSSVPQPILDLQEDIVKVKGCKQKAVANQNFELAASYRDQQAQMENRLESMKLMWERGEGEEALPVDEIDVAQVVSRMTGVPVERMEEAESSRLRKMGVKTVMVTGDNFCGNTAHLEQRRLPFRLGDKGSHPLQPDQQAFVRQLTQRAIDGHSAEAELGHQLSFRRDTVMRSPDAAVDLFADRLLHLFIERRGRGTRLLCKHGLAFLMHNKRSGETKIIARIASATNGRFAMPHGPPCERPDRQCQTAG